MTETEEYWINIGAGQGYFVQIDLVSLEKERVVSAYSLAEITENFPVGEAKHSEGYTAIELPLAVFECDCGEVLTETLRKGEIPACLKCNNKMNLIKTIEQ